MSATREEKLSESKVETLCLLDVDGTLTGRAGRECVTSELYKSLQKNPDDSYHKAEFINHNKMVSKLIVGLKLKENMTMGLAPNAKNFLITMIKKGAAIHLITKNRAEYVKALFEAEGLSENQIKHFKFSDVNSNKSKYGAAEDAVQKHMENRSLKYVIVCDDNTEDFRSMEYATKEDAAEIEINGKDAWFSSQLYGGNVIGRNSEPGKFNFPDILKELIKLEAAAAKEPLNKASMFKAPEKQQDIAPSDELQRLTIK